MITRAKFQNFKALRDVEVTFDSRLTVIVGPNGSGKTSVLQGIDSLLLLGLGIPFLNLLNARPEYMFLRFGHEPLTVLEVTGANSESEGIVGVRAELKRSDERGNRGLENEDIILSRLGDSRLDRWVPFTSTDKVSFPSATFAQLDPKLLASPTFPQGGFPHISPRGEGLASALASLALNNPSAFQEIIRHLKAIVPSVKNVRFNRFESDKPEQEPPQTGASPPIVQVRTRKYITEALLLDFSTASDVHVSDVSDGTLLVLGLLSMIYLYPNSSVMLLDDIDHGLHPKAQMELVELLKRVLHDFPNLQIIATSHSPYILDRLDWSGVRVTALQDDGSAICRPLTDHPDIERWREAMTPGEFWSHLGDEWVKKLDRNEPATVAP
jgi:Fe-S cluster assembly ATPase SufC